MVPASQRFWGSKWDHPYKEFRTTYTSSSEHSINVSCYYYLKHCALCWALWDLPRWIQTCSSSRRLQPRAEWRLVERDKNSDKKISAFHQPTDSQLGCILESVGPFLNQCPCPDPTQRRATSCGCHDRKNTDSQDRTVAPGREIDWSSFSSLPPPSAHTPEERRSKRTNSTPPRTQVPQAMGHVRAWFQKQLGWMLKQIQDWSFQIGWRRTFEPLQGLGSAYHTTRD